MSVVTNIIDALRKLGTSTQRTAIERQDEFLRGKQVKERRRAIVRSELGQASQFVATVEPTPETVQPLAIESIEPIVKNAKLVSDFINTFSGNQRGGSLLEDIEAAFRNWVESENKHGYTDDEVIEITGAAFGQYCVETLDMRWVRISDDYGVAIAVQGRVTDFRAYPYHAVEKRMPTGEFGFFIPIYISLQDASKRDYAPTET